MLPTEYTLTFFFFHFRILLNRTPFFRRRLLEWLLTFSVLLKGTEGTQWVYWQTIVYGSLLFCTPREQRHWQLSFQDKQLGRWSQGGCGAEGWLFAIQDQKIMSPPRPKPLMGLRLLGYAFTPLLCSAAPKLRGWRVRGTQEQGAQAACYTLICKGLCVCSRGVLWQVDVPACKWGEILDSLPFFQSPEKEPRNRALSLAGSFVAPHQCLPQKGNTKWPLWCPPS